MKTMGNEITVKAEGMTLAKAVSLLKIREKFLNVDKMSKFDRESAVYDEIASRGEFSPVDCCIVMAILQTPYHDSGKIEGIQSIDSSAHNCTFCQRMIEASRKNPAIICGHCYDYRQEAYKTNSKNRHGLQLRILSDRIYEAKYLALLDIHTPFFRFNSCGDIENAKQAVNYFRIAKTHPSASCALWSKNVTAVRLANRIEGKPENLVRIYSNPIIDGCCECPEGFDKVFTVYTAEKIDSAIKSGAFECNGKKCLECGYSCYIPGQQGNGNIAEKLRK